jgi:hypothetical protein
LHGPFLFWDVVRFFICHHRGSKDVAKALAKVKTGKILPEQVFLLAKRGKRNHLKRHSFCFSFNQVSKRQWPLMPISLLIVAV